MGPKTDALASVLGIALVWSMPNIFWLIASGLITGICIFTGQTIARVCINKIKKHYQQWCDNKNKTNQSKNTEETQ